MVHPNVGSAVSLSILGPGSILSILRLLQVFGCARRGLFFFCQDHRYVEIYDICYPQKMLDSSKIAIFTDFAVGHFLSLPTKWLDIRRVNLGHTPCSNMGRSQLVSLFIKSRHLYLFVSFCHHFQSGLGSIYFHQAKGIHVLREKKGIAQRLGTFASDFRPCVLPKTLI